MLQDHTPETLVEALRPLGATLGEARRIIAQVVQRGSDTLEGIRQVRATVRDGALALTPIGQLTVRERRASAEDPFVKYVLETHDGALLETVRIPLEKPGRYVVCVSSQVGCAMGCTFCATGRMGLVRNLATWEIIEQIRIVSRELRATGQGRVHGVVFQGMGEPLHNVDNVLRALAILSEPAALAIDARNVTVCTVGIVPGIRRLTASGTRARLGISVTSAQAMLRRSLVPMDDRYPLAEVMDAAQGHHQATGYLVMLAFALLGGVNTTEEEARAISVLLQKMPARLSLIDWNPVPGMDYRPPTAEERTAFHDALARLGVPVVRRYSGGKDIDAACGQLATESRRVRTPRSGVTPGETAAE